MRILFTGGGTGGHIYPILAVTEELQSSAVQKKINLDLRYFGAPETYRLLLNENGVLVSKIFSAKWRRYFDIRNFLDIPLFLISIFQALLKIFWFMPDVLFSKGGPGSLAIVLTSRFYRIPVIIHESDSIPGLTTLFSQRYADKIITSFKSTEKFFPENSRAKIILAGNPVRQSLLSDVLAQGTAKKVLGFNPEKPLIVIIGGSQGAVKINDFMMEIAEEMAKDWQILHQTGAKNFEDAGNELTLVFKNSAPETKSNYKITPYFGKNLKDVFAAADLIVSRAGSGSIFEIAAFGKPSILIPLKESANNHQSKNAYEYAKTGAAIVIEEENLHPTIFLTQIKKILSQPEISKSMSEAAKRFSKPEAAKIIAEEIISLVSR